MLLATVLSYVPGLPGSLLFDDLPALTANPLVQIEGGVADHWRAAALSSDSGPLHRPLAMLSFAANHALSGSFDPTALKLTNVAIHLAIGVLVFLLALELRVFHARHSTGARAGSEAIALLAAALWLLHPLQVSSVLYVVQRMAQLSTLFVVLGLWYFTRQRARWAAQRPAPGDVVATVLWLGLILVLAMYSKENGLLLPWLMAVVEVAIFRGYWDGERRRWLEHLGWLALLSPLALIALLLVVEPGTLIGGYSHRPFTLEERLLTQLRLLWQYLGWLLLPDIGSMGFQHDDIPWSRGWLTPWTTLTSGLAWLIVLLLSFVLRARFPFLLLAVLFYLVGHSMESGLIALEMVYEHRNYLPSVGLFILLATLIAAVAERVKGLSFGVLGAALSLLLAVLLGLRALVWSDELLLAKTNLQHHPQSARSNYFYALRLLEHYEDTVVSDGTGDMEPLLAARHYYERMHQEDPQNLGPLTMLYYLDERYFPGLHSYANWLAMLAEAARSRKLQATDWASLRFIVDCFELAACGDRGGEVLAVLEQLSVRYPGSPGLYIQRYRLQKVLGAPPRVLSGLLEQARAVRPESVTVYSYLIRDAMVREDVAAAYRAAGDWLRYDFARRQLALVKQQFRQPGQ
ncbi:MAG: hypothetical protein ACK5HY_15820 [Parahaliea sp.]